MELLDIVPVIKKPSRWYFVAVAHPPSKSDHLDDVTNEFTNQELKRMKLEEFPLLYEHNSSLVLGKIEKSAYSDELGKMFVGYIDLSKDRVRKIYEEQILTGNAVEFSLEHVFSDKIYADGSRTSFRFLTEVSFVKKGNRDNCHLILGMDDIELEKKEYLKYKFEQLVTDISERDDYSLGADSLDKDREMSGQPPTQPSDAPGQQPPQQQPTQPEAEKASATNAENQTKLSKEEILNRIKPDDMAGMLLTSAASIAELKKRNESLEIAVKKQEQRADEELKTVAQLLMDKFTEMNGAKEAESKEFNGIVERLHNNMGPGEKQDLSRVFTMVASNAASASAILAQKKREYETFLGNNQPQPKKVDSDDAFRQNILRHLTVGSNRFEPYARERAPLRQYEDPRQYEVPTRMDTGESQNERYRQPPKNERLDQFIPRKGEVLHAVAELDPVGYAESIRSTGGRSREPLQQIREMLLNNGAPLEIREKTNKSTP